jgi:hypothetical protein
MCETSCGAPSATTFTASVDTLHRLGLPAPLDGKPVVLRVCAGCYLSAMGLMLERAGLPRPQPLPVEYYCATCDKTIPVPEVAFVGGRGVTPMHAAQAGAPGSAHPLQVRVVRAQTGPATLA